MLARDGQRDTHGENINMLAIVLSPLLAVDSGTVFHLTLDPHKLCLFSVTV